MGRLGLCVGVRRRPVAADQPVAHAVRGGRMSVPDSRRPASSRSTGHIRRGSASGRRCCCCSAFPGSSWSTRIPRCRCIWRGSRSAIPPSPSAAWCCSAATPGCATAKSSPSCSRPSRASPRREARAGPPRQLLLRPFGAGLLDSAGVSNSMTAFVLLLLATVLFDGASTSPEWTSLESAACRPAFAARRACAPWRSRPPG